MRTIILFISILLISCYKGGKARIIKKKETDVFLIDYKPIKQIKNIKSGEIEKFNFIIDTTKILKKGAIKFFHLKTDIRDSIYIGINKDTLYMYDESIDYFEKTFILNFDNIKYASFFCAYDYRINDVVNLSNSNSLDTIYKFSIEKVKAMQGTDYFYISTKKSFYNKEVKELTFSKKKGVISMLLYDAENDEEYITIMDK